MKDWTPEGVSKEWIERANDAKITRVLSRKSTRERDTVEQKIRQHWIDSGYETTDSYTLVQRKGKTK